MSNKFQEKVNRHKARVVVMNAKEFNKRKKSFETQATSGGFMRPVKHFYWWHGCEVLVDNSIEDGVFVVRPRLRRIT